MILRRNLNVLWMFYIHKNEKNIHLRSTFHIKTYHDAMFCNIWGDKQSTRLDNIDFLRTNKSLVNNNKQKTTYLIGVFYDPTIASISLGLAWHDGDLAKRAGPWLILILYVQHWQKCFFKKQVSGVGWARLAHN